MSRNIKLNEAMKTCDTFDYSQRMKLLSFLVEMEVKIVEHADGCRINLDKLSENQSDLLYNKIKELDIPLEPVHQI